MKEIASTASATASSSREGSKRMLGPTAITSSVIGGRLECPFCVGCDVVLVFGVRRVVARG